MIQKKKLLFFPSKNLFSTYFLLSKTPRKQPKNLIKLIFDLQKK